MATLIHEQLPTLRKSRGWSISVLSRQTVRPGDTGVGEKTIEAIERNPGRIPDARIIEALAAALGISPETFYEYPIAVKRRDAKERAAEKRLDTELEREAARSGKHSRASGARPRASDGRETAS